MNEPLINLECYEPAGTSLDFTVDDLLGHTLAIGGSGSGKTSRLILPIVSKLINASDQPVGLCILDTKADGIAERAVQRACFDAAREDDLVIIKGNGDNFLNLFREVNSDGLSAIEALSALLGSTIPRDPSNKYWERTLESLLTQSLRLIELSENMEWNYHTVMEHLIRYLLLHQLRDPVYIDMIDVLKDSKQSYDSHSQFIIDEVVANHRMWETLDPRTRSILQSMTASLIAVMNSKNAHSFFDGENPIDIATAVEDQKIILISIDGIRYPEVARLVAGLTKGLFYSAVLKNDAHNESNPISGLILDDWPICITAGSGNRFSDIDALAMIRSRGGFVVAATQSFAAIDIVAGQAARSAAVANFANLIFFRGRDTEVDLLATTYLGQKIEKLTDISIYEGGSATIKRNLPTKLIREIRTPAVPIGAIARLATGEAYALIGPTIYNKALCLIPQKQNQHIPS